MSDHVLIVQAREGHTLSVSTVPQPFLRKVNAEAAQVEIFVRYADEPVGTEQSLGTVMPGQTLVREYNPDRDRDLVISKIVRADDGTPDVGQMLDADSVALPINRITEAPELNQAEDSTWTDVVLGVKVGVYTRVLRVQISDDIGFTSPETTDFEVTAGTLPDLVAVEVARITNDPLDRFFRVAASGGGGTFGPWSDILTVTFADNLGAGGSSGTGGFPPGGGVLLEHNES